LIDSLIDFVIKDSLHRPNDGHITCVVECLLDLNFVVDSSGSINFEYASNFNTSLQFVANVVRAFAIGPNSVQVAFVIFGNTARVEWSLTQYRDQTSLVNAILRVAYLGDDQETNLAEGLYLTRTNVFASGRGSRANAVQVTVILTDGVDNVPDDRTPLTIQNATACKQAGITLIAIGVTESVDEARLRDIVTDRNTDYYAVTDFNALSNLVSKLRAQICVAPPTGIRPHSTCPSSTLIAGFVAVEMP